MRLRKNKAPKEYIAKVMEDKKGMFLQMPENFIKDTKMKVGDDVSFIILEEGKVLMQIKKASPGVHDKIIDECLEVVRAALTEPYIDLSIFLMAANND